MEGIRHPHPSLPPSRGKGFLVGVLDLRLVHVKLVLLPCFVGEAVADKVFCCFHAVADFDAGGLASHCFREEARDVFTVFGETVNLVLYVCWIAHRL